MPPKVHKILRNEDDTLLFAAQLASQVPSSCIIYLSGDLGAGKTTFVRGILRGLGYRGKVKSPTFTLIEPYEIADHTIFHFDLYRLTSAEELENMGIRDYFSKPAICLIEWPEKGAPLLPQPDLTCYLDFSPNDQRSISLESHRSPMDKVLMELEKVK